MLLHELKSNIGARKRKKRVGRGNSSGKGTFSSRGCKGQNARSGGGVRPGFEGGQTPLYKRIPKMKGFNNRFKKEYQIVNLDQLNKLSEEKVNFEVMLKHNLIKAKPALVKVLSKGEYSQKAEVSAHSFSKTAQEKIESSGGKTLIIS
jgi:large subunit ribosomal protein L15